MSDLDYYRKMGEEIGFPAAVAPSMVAMVWAVVTGQWLLFAVLWLSWVAAAALVYRRRLRRSG